MGATLLNSITVPTRSVLNMVGLNNVADQLKMDAGTGLLGKISGGQEKAYNVLAPLAAAALGGAAVKTDKGFLPESQANKNTGNFTTDNKSMDLSKYFGGASGGVSFGAQAQQDWLPLAVVAAVVIVVITLFRGGKKRRK